MAKRFSSSVGGSNEYYCSDSGARNQEKTSGETRYFIASLDATDPKRLGQIVRAHWGTENNLHWVFYAFEEDSQRTRLGNSAANMAILRHIVLNLIRSDTKAKIGVKNRRLKAGWDDDYLLSN